MGASGIVAFPRTATPDAPPGEQWIAPVGGQHGAADIPSRNTTAFPVPPPASAGGTGGPVPIKRRGPWINTGTIDRPQVGNEFGHMSIAWSRPYFPNDAGVLGYIPPTQLPNWTANAVPSVDNPNIKEIPISYKRIDSATVNQEFGSTRELFPWPNIRAIIQPRNAVQRARWRASAKTSNPYSPRLSVWGLAGSYGQTTLTLNTGPISSAAPPPGLTQAQASNSGMGSY
jgi:hypothetical protein